MGVTVSVYTDCLWYTLWYDIRDAMNSHFLNDRSETLTGNNSRRHGGKRINRCRCVARGDRSAIVLPVALQCSTRPCRTHGSLAVICHTRSLSDERLNVRA
ncbi:hypothetical protein ABBQ38_000786 [Trebouxia sp. C0009 RCD-2024]